ncbi:Hypothetical predicted protein [Mytilus galloprovincialis]|uniref:C-type lectin domain-containing protein n=1 Tax=Mytilus galloprovincialis TaxID=29158 RepID=A0A8B6H5D4_MYTGA|nr:Hypothetical predicted protein [Mytilus galloprovincialis]
MKIKSPSGVSCAAICNKHTMCSYYSYNDDDKLCVIHSNLEGETTLISDLKWRIYKPAYWIGATDFETEDVWKWNTTQTMVTVTDWSPGQPDNYLGNQDCVQIMTSEGYRWDDNLCEALRAFACEMLTF